MGGEKKKIVFLSGFLAVFARSGSARITVFKSNLIQAGWLRSPGMRLLWMGLPVALLGHEAAGRARSRGLKIPAKVEGEWERPCPSAIPCSISVLTVKAWIQMHQILHTEEKKINPEK